VQKALRARDLVPHATDRGDDVVDADAEGRLEVDEVEVFRSATNIEPVGREKSVDTPPTGLTQLFV